MTARFAVFASAVALIYAAVLGLGIAEDVPLNPEKSAPIRVRRVSPDRGLPSCLVPLQPAHGEWKLHREFCDYGVDCGIPQGIALLVGSQLIYSCNPGYKVEGNVDVHCTAKGSWSATPSCIEVKCSSLNSESRLAICDRSDQSVDCDSLVLPGTRARVSCLPGYSKDTTLLLEQGEIVTCNVNGKWEPDPIRCEPACGVQIYRQTALVIGGTPAKIADFPWHATIYAKRNTTRGIEYQVLCGATIIRANLLLTAAHCVFNEVTETTADPKILFIMTGNIFRDWDSPEHDLQVVRKGRVKTVYKHPNYHGLTGNFASDIALLELQEPFVLSSILLPACLDVPGRSEQILEPGAYGRVAGFGRTATGAYTGILQTTNVPYVSYSQCKSFLDSAGYGSFVTNQTFCAGHRNVSESGVCTGDAGGGLVFNENNQWYVLGILSIPLGTDYSSGERMCNRDIPSLYTKLSLYLPWILNVIFHLERYGSHTPAGSHNTSVAEVPTVVPTPTSRPTEGPIMNSSSTEFACLVPPQPENGEWKFQGDLCGNNRNCRIPQGTLLKPGSQLVYSRVYSCAPGYKTNGSNEIYCRERGDWSAVVNCIELRCDALNSVSTIASCSHLGKRLSCDFPVPSGTRAEVSCNPGYKKDAVFIATRRETVSCTENGKWEPEPIRCVPVCGIAITHQMPNVIGGTTTSIGDFPWHASLYVATKSLNETKKVFTCGATIIHTNYLLTAAHCVYDENFRKTADANKLFVMTGNIFRDWDFKWHSEIVKRSAVKNVYRHSNYYGLLGNFVSDIALLELQRPFVFSRLLLPACLDVEGYSEQILEPGALGRVAGFGRTATGSSSAILQTLTVPYVTYKQCRSSKSAQFNDFFISNDKFCAGYTNGTSVCEGDSGGGLVFQRNDLWYVMGIVSVSLGVDLDNGEKTCDKYSYALYSKVSTYMQWIHDVIANPERYKL